MTDIHTIKNLLYFFPYLKEETWYMIGIGSVVYAIYIAYLIAFERYYKAQENGNTWISEQKSIREILWDLDTEDERFFERLSFIVRKYLEESELSPSATKKTHRDIQRESIPKQYKKALDICTYYEYTGETADKKKKQETLELLKEVM